MKMTEQSAKWMHGVVANCEKNTGKPLAQWVALARKAKLADLKAARAWGKTQGLSVVYTTAVSDLLFPSIKEDDAGLVDAQYVGAKTALRPIYDALIAAIRKFGKYVEIMPRKSQVTCSRTKSFAVIRPATKDRVDVALRLAGAKATPRLVANRGAGSSDPSHTVGVRTTKEVDRELIGWLRAAYNGAQ